MTWILPTYGRAKQCAQVLRALSEHKCSTPGLVFCNGPRDEYEREVIGAGALPANWTLHFHHENVAAIGAMNWYFNKNPNEDWYGFISDDEYVLTDNWDKTLISAAGKLGIANGDDGFMGRQRVQGLPCFGGGLVRAIGYIAIPTCWHWYGTDAMWESIDRVLKIRKFCPDVRIEHRHAYNRKSPMDETYRMGESRAVGDQRAFNRWYKEERPAVVGRIKLLSREVA